MMNMFTCSVELYLVILIRLSQQSEVCVWWSLTPVLTSTFALLSVCVCVCVCTHARACVCLCVCIIEQYDCFGSLCHCELFSAWTFWGETELKFSLSHTRTHTRLSKASQTHAIVFQLINQQQSFQFFILPNYWFKKRFFHMPEHVTHLPHTHSSGFRVRSYTHTHTHNIIRKTNSLADAVHQSLLRSN